MKHKKISIAILGLHPHAGVTRFTILLSEYLANYHGLQVEVIEKNPKRDFSSLQPMKDMSIQDIFLLHHVTYYHYNQEMSGHVLSEESFDYCIYDIGSSYGREQELTSNCDKLVLLFQMTPWYFELEQLKNILQQFEDKTEKIYFVGNMIDVCRRREISRLLKRVEYLEYEPHLFVPSVQAIRVFHQIVFRDRL